MTLSSRRAIFGVLLAALLVAQAVVASLVLEDAQCDDDGCGGGRAEDDCPPFCGDCQDCLGCFRPLGLTAAPVVVPASLARLARSLRSDLEPPRPEPAEILVVPRSA